MNPVQGASNGKYGYLLALNLGEKENFPNKPTPSEAALGTQPSSRHGYTKIQSALGKLRKENPNVVLNARLHTTKNSPIKGNRVIVTCVSKDGVVSSPEEAARAVMLLGRAKQGAETRKRNAKEGPRQAALPLTAPKKVAQMLAPRRPNAYDPAQVAKLVTAMLGGATIQTLSDGMWRDEPFPSWIEPTAHYRIKPVEAREWFLHLNETNGVIHAYKMLDDVPGNFREHCVLVREVIANED